MGDKKKLSKLQINKFSGSIDEPTLHPELLEILDWTMLDVNISSNGSTKTTKINEFRQKNICILY